MFEINKKLAEALFDGFTESHLEQIYKSYMDLPVFSKLKFREKIMKFLDSLIDNIENNIR